MAAGTLSNQLIQALRSFPAHKAVGEEMKTILAKSRGRLASASFSIATEDMSDGIVVSIQLLDEDGNDLTEATAVLAILADDAAAAAINSDDYTIAAGTDGALVQLVADQVLLLVSEADGDIDVSLTIDGAATVYLILVMPNGNLVSSGAITHAA